MEKSKKYTATTFLLGLQHLLAMFGATVLVPLITGMSTSIALFTAGVGTLFFHLVTKRKVPVFLGSSFSFIVAIQSVIASHATAAEKVTSEGIAYACGGIVVAGMLYLALALLVKLFGVEKVSSFFPPIVTGPIVMVIGLGLAPVVFNSFIIQLDSAGVPAPMLAQRLIAATVVVVTIVALTMYAKGLLKLVPIVVGILVGYIASSLMGIVDFTPIQKAAFFAPPPFLLPKFELSAILQIAPIALVTFAEHIGGITTCGVVTGNDFLRDPGLHRTLIGDGVATSLAGFIGGPANTTYGENTGVLALTKNYNPATLRIAACFAILLSFIGKFAGMLQSVPLAVVGGVSIILFGMIASIGLRTLTESQPDFSKGRTLILVSLILVIGLGAKFSIGTLEITGLSVAAVIGIVLNKLLPDR